MAENDRIENGTPVWPGWETVRLIGRGSFGAVYEIEREVFGHKEKAAVKRITIPQNNSDIDELYDSGFDEQSVTETFRAHMQSIVSEYTLMREMNGAANIVNTDDFRCVQHDDGIGWDIYIKMELLTPLTKDLPARPDDATVIRIARDMCRALVLCRRFGIIHRDIKPQNIFVSRIGDYKLGDFGIAKTVEKTSGGTKIGTYKYMAPEVYNNRPYGHTADIYSLGLVLHWMLNERRSPFVPLPPAPASSAGEEEARMRRFAGEPLPPPAHGSEELKRIVLKACAFEPEARYQSADEMLRELERLDAPYVFDAAGKKENTPAPDSPERPAPADAENEATVSGAFTGARQTAQQPVQQPAQPYAQPYRQHPAYPQAPRQYCAPQQSPYAPQGQYAPQQAPYMPPRQSQYSTPQGQYAPRQTPSPAPEPPRNSRRRNEIPATAPEAADDESTIGAPGKKPTGSASPAPAKMENTASRPNGPKGTDKDKKKRALIIAAISGGAFLLTVLALVLALVFGGSKSAPVPAPAPAPAEIRSCSITVCVPSSLEELTAEQIERFNESNTLGVRFEPSFVIANEGEAASLIRSGQVDRPDIFTFTNDQTAVLIAAGALDVLPESTAAAVRAENSAGSVSTASVGGVLYAYPMSADNGFFMYYDRSVIPDSDAGSLEAIIADCEASGKKLCFDMSSGWYGMSFFLATGCVSEWETDAEGRPVAVNDTVNSPEGLAAAKGMRTLMCSNAWDDSSSCIDGFNGGKAAVVISGVWDYYNAKSMLGDSLGVAELPSFTVDGRSYHLGSFSGSKLIGVGPQSDPERAEALHQLAAYLCGEECQAERYQIVGYGPSNLAAQQLTTDDPALSALLAQDAYAVPMRSIPGGWWDIETTLNRRVAAAANETEIAAALEEYESDVHSLLTGG